MVISLCFFVHFPVRRSSRSCKVEVRPRHCDSGDGLCFVTDVHWVCSIGRFWLHSYMLILLFRWYYLTWRFCLLFAPGYSNGSVKVRDLEQGKLVWTLSRGARSRHHQGSTRISTADILTVINCRVSEQLKDHTVFSCARVGRSTDRRISTSSLVGLVEWSR